MNIDFGEKNSFPENSHSEAQVGRAWVRIWEAPDLIPEKEKIWLPIKEIVDEIMVHYVAIPTSSVERYLFYNVKDINPLPAPHLNVILLS